MWILPVAVIGISATNTTSSGSHQLATLGQGRIAMKTRRAIYLSATGWVSLLSEGDGYAMAYFDRAAALLPKGRNDVPHVQ